MALPLPPQSALLTTSGQSGGDAEGQAVLDSSDEEELVGFGGGLLLFFSLSFSLSPSSVVLGKPRPSCVCVCASFFHPFSRRIGL